MKATRSTINLKEHFNLWVGKGFEPSEALASKSTSYTLLVYKNLPRLTTLVPTRYFQAQKKLSLNYQTEFKLLYIIILLQYRLNLSDKVCLFLFVIICVICLHLLCFLNILFQLYEAKIRKFIKPPNLFTFYLFLL